MTAINNNVKKSIAPKSMFDDMSAFLDAAASFNQGDQLCYDTGTFKIRVVAADADSATFLGAARETVVLGKPKSAYPTEVDASQALTAVPGPVFGVEVEYDGHVGDALNPGDKLYLCMAIGAQTVTNVPSAGTSHAIGHYNGPAVGAVVAGQKVIVMLGARFPDDTLKY